MLGLVIAGCNNLEDSESSMVGAAPTASMEISAVGDSIFTLELISSTDGYIGYVLSEDTSLSIVALNIISGNMDGDVTGVGTYEYTASEETVINIGGLMPDTYYKVLVASSNTDGVESDVESYILKTNDNYGPTFTSSNPAIATTAAVAIDADFILTFDEPVLVGNGKFTFRYYFEGEETEVPAENISADGMTITVKQPRTGHTGDYVFLSWEEGAVTDLSGNVCNANISGVIEGALAGNYYRFERINFGIDDQIISPATDSILAAHDFTIDITFPFNIYLEELSTDMVKLKYTDWLGLSVVEVTAFENIEVVNDSILRITQPFMARHGDAIQLYIAEGVISDEYSNVNNASEYTLAWELGDFMMPTTVYPENGSIVTDQTFYVEYDFGFPISLVTADDAGKITMTYTSAEGITTEVIATEYGVDPSYSDSILYILTPNPVDFGGNVSINIDENVVMDTEGNVNLKLTNDTYWNVPALAESIDILVGQYVINGISYYDETYNMNDTITIAIKEGTTDSLVITGFFGFEGEVYAAYDAAISYLSFDEQAIGSGEDRNYTIFSATEDSKLGTYVLADGTINSDMALGVYDGSWGWLGFGEYIPTAIWTKLSNETVSATTKSSQIVRNVPIHKRSKEAKF